MEFGIVESDLAPPSAVGLPHESPGPDDAPGGSQEGLPDPSGLTGLDRAIAECERTLAHLAGTEPAAFGAGLWAHLVARDALAQARAGGDPPDLAHLRRVQALDEQLRRTWATHPGRRDVDLARWRDLVRPPADAWWWRLDERPPNILWLIVAGFCVAASISLTTDILRRLLSEGPDFVTVFSALSQAALTVLAGSTLTEAGRGAIDRFLARHGVPAGNRHRWTTGLAAGALLVILAFRFSLPALAGQYHALGLRQHDEDRQVSSAIESYRHAISLDPDNPAFHYDLGRAYEDVLDFGQAQSEYQLALQANTQEGYAAYNNLARLYLLRQNAADAASALRLTTEGLARAPDDPNVLYTLYKNRAWAHLTLNLPGQAQADLARALALRPDGAAAHCLQALAYEAQAQPEAAGPAWLNCVRYALPDQSVEPQWVATARERLEGGSQ